MNDKILALNQLIFVIKRSAHIGYVRYQHKGKRIPHRCAVNDLDLPSAAILCNNPTHFVRIDSEIDGLGGTLIAVDMKHNGCLCLVGHVNVVTIVDRIIGAKGKLGVAALDEQRRLNTRLAAIGQVDLLCCDLDRDVARELQIGGDLKCERCDSTPVREDRRMRANGHAAVGAAVRDRV